MIGQPDTPPVHPARLFQLALRATAGTAAWIAVGFATTLLLVLSALGPFGFHSYIVRSPSMRPAIHTGDIVIDKTIRADSARIGDTITYRDPQHPDRTITHRVRAVSQHGATDTFTTMGIANNTTQTWNIAARGSIGRVAWRIPKVGLMLAAAQNPTGLIVLVVFPTLGLAFIGLTTIWTKKRRTPNAHRIPHSDRRIRELRTLVNIAQHDARHEPGPTPVLQSIDRASLSRQGSCYSGGSV